MSEAVNPNVWTGRDDGAEAGDVRRLFQIVRNGPELVPAGAAAILGFACDTGVLRNKGRIGAARGPEVIRRMMAGLPAHQLVDLWDCGDVTCTDGDLEFAQFALGDQVAQLMAQGVAPVVLGGGHEVAWGTFLGLRQWLSTHDGAYKKRSLLVLNLDAHFDLRTSRPASSGTPFDQIARDCEQANRPFKYACWGVSVLGNTPALFARATQIHADVILDDQLQERHLEAALQRLDVLIREADDIYLTIDLDVLPASVAPGVSAPAAYGVPLSVVEALAMRVKHSRKMRVADLAEFNPNFDIDGHTGRVAARLAWRLLGDQ